MDEKLNSILTVQDLVEAMERVSPDVNDEDGDEVKKNYRYIIYARRSTDDTSKQVRSLSDQVAECKEMAHRLGLQIKGSPVLESESAKEPDIRPKFRAMIEAIKNGEADGIIAWHPDRLARNMKDAGEVIDLLDKKIIKDLRFVCFTFENNATGKMLLGITFALSKQYSDQLSTNVKRGNERSIQEGKALQVVKHGYYKDREGYLRPDYNNFFLLQNAFKMRLNGATLDLIADFLNTSGYKRAKRNEKAKEGYFHIDCKMDKKKLSVIFKDTFYVGVLLHNNKKINLLECGFNFQPIITPQEYLAINENAALERAGRLNKKRGKNTRKADFARGMVICDDCGMPMTAGITNKREKGKLTKYYYFRCDTPKCPFRHKSVRGKVIIQFVIDFIEKHHFDSREAYNHFEQSIKYILAQKNEELTKRLKYLNLTLTQKKTRIADVKNTLYTETDPDNKKIYKADLNDALNERKKIESEIKQLESYLEKAKKTVITYEDFIELAQQFANLTRNIRTIKDWDFVVRKVFLNFTVKDKKVANYTINSPFRELIESSNVLIGRASET